MKNLMYLSVIIPCYNSESCIGPLLKCLENQTIGIENLDIIFVDDYSKDGTCMKLKEFQKYHPQNVTIIENDKNYGVSYSRNQGIENSHTPYVTFADHDDVLERELCEVLYENIIKNDCEIVMCAHDYITEKEIYGICEKNRNGNSPCSNEQQINQPATQIFKLQNQTERKKFMLQFRNDLECWSKLIHKNFLLEHRIDFPKGMWGEDFYWWNLIEMNLNSLCWVPRILYHHIRKNEPVTSKEMQNWMPAQLLLNLEAKKRGLYQEYYEILDLELYEVGFASTLYYWIMGNNYSVPELEALRQIVLKETTDIFHNTYICNKEFRFRYSEYALQLLREEITINSIRDFLRNMIAVLSVIGIPLVK